MARRNRYIFAEEKPRRARAFLLGLLAVVLLAVLTLVVYNFGVNNQVTYVRQKVTVPELSGDLENWTILHFSDLNGRYVSDQHAAIRKAVDGKSCSCIVFTGDMVGEGGDVQPLLDLVALLPAGTPKLLIPGDADPPLLADQLGESPYAPWVIALQNAGVTVLDEPVSFTRNKSTIWFVPEYLYSLDIDNMEAAYQAQLDRLNATLAPLNEQEMVQRRQAEYQVARMQRLRETLRTVKESDVQVALTHAPLTLDYVRTMRQANTKSAFSLRHVDLVLAGHYAGGQWRLPGLGAIYVPELGGFPQDELIQGMDYLDGLPQYISPGLSSGSAYPMPGRLFNSPTVTMITLTANIS